MVSTINLYHGRINNWLRSSLGHKPPMAVLYTFLGILPILLMQMIILPCLFRTVTWHFSEHPINLLKKKKRTKWLTAWQLHQSTGIAGVHPGKSAMPGILFILESGGSAPGSPSNKVICGGKWEEGALSKSLTSKFSGGQDYSKGENQSGCFSASTSLLEKDHTEWASVTKYNCENKTLAGKKGVSRKVRRAYLEAVHLIFPGNS